MATTYMNLSLPTVSVTPGPGWASQLNTAFEAIDAHDHSSGKGPRVTPSGLDISSDLSMGSNDLTNARSVRYINSSGSLGGAADTNCVYVYAGNLYYNNNSGTAIKLTDAGALNAAGLVPSRGQQAVAGTHTILASDTYITLKVNTTAARTINLPAASGVSAGRYYIIQDVSGQSETNAITLVRNGSDTIENVGGNFSLEIDNGVWEIESDGLSNWKVTRAMPDFLTKSTLTLGSAVLNATSLTLSTTVLNTSYLAIGSSTAASGIIRLPNLQYIRGRNAANSGDIDMISVNAVDGVSIGGGATATYFGNGSGHLVYGSAALSSYITFDQNVATGTIRFPAAGFISNRNAANTQDRWLIGSDASDNIDIGGRGALGYSAANTVTISGSTAIKFVGAPVEGYDENGNPTTVSAVTKFLSASSTTTSATPQSSSLSFKVGANEIWNIQIDGGINTQAGSGGYFGFTFPGVTTWAAGGYAIHAAPNYATLTGIGDGSSTICLFDTDGVTAPFKMWASIETTQAGTVTFMRRAFSGGDSILILQGTSLVARRGNKV